MKRYRNKISPSDISTYLNKYFVLLKKIEKRIEKSVVLHHGDPDGLLSAYFARKVFSDELRARQDIYWVGNHQLNLAEFLEYTKQRDHRTIFTFDIEIYSNESLINYCNENEVTLISYDDHVVLNSKSSPHVHYLNPNIGRNSETVFPPFLFCYYLYSKNAGKFADATSNDLNKVLLSAARSEHILDIYGDLFRSVDVEGSDQFKFIKNLSSYFFHESAASIRNVPLELLESANADIFSAISNSDVARRYSNDIDRSVAAEVASAKGCAVENGNTAYFHMVQSGNRIMNLVASRIRNECSFSVVVAFQKIGENISVELRRKSKLKRLDFIRILSKLSKSGNVDFVDFGGHPPAAGASFNPSQLEVFKDALIESLSKEIENEWKVFDNSK